MSAIRDTITTVDAPVVINCDNLRPPRRVTLSPAAGASALCEYDAGTGWANWPAGEVSSDASDEFVGVINALRITLTDGDSVDYQVV